MGIVKRNAYLLRMDFSSMALQNSHNGMLAVYDRYREKEGEPLRLRMMQAVLGAFTQVFKS